MRTSSIRGTGLLAAIIVVTSLSAGFSRVFCQPDKSRLPQTVTNIASGPFAPTWKSLAAFKCPDWFRDSKFGIFMHWGGQSVPANDGWYARNMYMQYGAPWGNAYAYHLKTYGHPSKVGYKDLLPLWKAEKWNPDSLAALYKNIGAKYIVYVAVHHDNVDNFASTYQPWNSVNIGPKRDVTLEWKRATEKHGLRFGVSSHSDRTWSWFETSRGADSTGPLKGVLYDGNLTKADGKGKWWEGFDPQQLYGRPHPKNAPPDAEFMVNWYNRTRELIDKYRPDILYFDGPLPLGDYGLNIAAHYYNSNMSWHNGAPEAVLNIKSWGPGTIPDERAIVLDIEKGQIDTLNALPWQTDTSLPGPWFYAPEPLELSDTVVIHNLCDIVSKNGNLLLNVGLKADGSLPDDQRQILLGIGEWLEVNGEAIYGTRPWKISGEGKTRMQGGDFKQNTTPLTSDDIRFTTKGKTLYAIALGWPQNGKVTIHSLPKDVKLLFGHITSVEMLGVQAKLKWEQTGTGLTIQTPDKPPCRYAYVFKIGGTE